MFLNFFRESVSIFNDLFDLFCNFSKKHARFLMVFDDFVLNIFREAVSIFNDLFDLFCNFSRKHGRFLMMFDDVFEKFLGGSVDF